MNTLKSIFCLLSIFFINQIFAQADPYYSIIVDAGELVTTNVNANTSFIVKTISVNGYDIVKYEWDFNNDNIIDATTSINTGNYTYSTQGEYYATVLVTNSQGESSYDAVKVIVGNGLPVQQSFERQPISIPVLKSSKPADGIRKNYAVMINGSKEKRFWDDVYDMYTTLKTVYGYSDENIFVLNDDGLDFWNNPRTWIDYAATLDNVTKVFTELSNTLDEDDILFLWVTDHGKGYAGKNCSMPENYGVIHSRAAVDPGDEQDYLESDFKLRGLFAGGSVSYPQRQGMEQWRISSSYGYCRTKYVSRYDITLKNGTRSFDNDIYIEKFIDYLVGDSNADGIIDKNAGETLDGDGDGILPYDRATGVFDEGDWGAVDTVIDNYNTLNNTTPGNPWFQSILFDKDFDNRLDIDINPVCSIGNCTENQLIADGTDFDNDGLFDGIDANQDGNKTDWISIDESIILVNSVLYDDDLKIMLNSLSTKNIIVFLQQCFGGGFIEDLSKKGRVIMSATTEEDYSWENTFVGYFRDAVHNTTLADANSDGKVSMLEAFNYAANLDSGEECQYDDNGDQVSNQVPVPSGGDGCLGATLSLSGLLLNNLSLSNTTISSSRTYQADNITINNVTIQNYSSVIFNIAGGLDITKDFELKLGSTLEINNSQCP